MKALLFITRLLLFWMLFFIVQQLLFFCLDLSSYKGTSLEFMHSIWIGLRMNLAGSIYLLSIPIISLIASLWGLNDKWTNAIIKWESFVLLFICCLLCSIDIGIYKAWGTKFNAKALAYLAYPKEVLPLLYDRTTLFLFPVILLEMLVFVWIWKKWMGVYSMSQTSWTAKLSVSVFLIVAFIIGARGGTQKLPLNRNQIFFSEHQLLNYGAMNSLWNLGELISHPIEPTKNPYPFYPEKLALQYLKDFNKAAKDSTIEIFKSKRPNIVLIFLESWTADVVECVGGEKNVAPNFGKLAKEGMLFSNFYSSGYRTEQGLLAMLSGFPAQPQGSVIYSWGKFDKLPNLYIDLKKQGYYTSFYYGGRLQFDNVEAYLRSAGVEHMVGENDFAIKKRTVWGAYDEEIFALHLNDIKAMKEPFFSTLGTISTHEWWDSDVTQVFKNSGGDELNDKYRNTVHYSDSCLYAYLKSAQQQSWYANTIFILVADHGCRFPLQRNNYEVGRHHIPMLLIGGALKDEYRGTINNRIASHTDLAATLFGQLSLTSSDYLRSKNIFNPYSPEFAYYSFDNGFGLITKDKTVIFDNNQNKDMLNPKEDSLSLRLIKYGKAYLQCTNSFAVGANK